MVWVSWHLVQWAWSGYQQKVGRARLVSGKLLVSSRITESVVDIPHLQGLQKYEREALQLALLPCR